jgi:glycogen debranching enzyme
LGPFTKSFLKIRDHAEAQREYAFKNFLAPLFTSHICEAGLGTASEIFDGDSPHVPRGCISQAWSIAELLRAYFEDVLLIRPAYERKVLNKST